jgi:O-antigen ligase
MPRSIHRPTPSDPGRGSSSLLQSFAVVGLSAGSALVVMVTTSSRPLAAMAAMIPLLLLAMSQPQFIRRLLLLIVAVEIPTQIDQYVGHDVREAAWQSVSGFNVSLTTFAVIGLFWLLVVETTSGSTKVRRPSAALTVPVVLYTVVVVASWGVASNGRMALYEIVIVVQALLIFLYVAIALRDRSEILLVLLGVAGAVILQGVLAIWLTVGPSKLDFGILTASRGGTRVGGTFNSPNALGGYLVLALPPMLGLAIGAPRPASRMIGAAATAFGGLALLLTSSRGAWVGTAAGITVALWIARRRRWIGNASLGAFIGAAVVAGGLMADRIVERLTAFDNAAALSRLPLMQLAWEMSLDHPVLGVGANNFATALPTYLTTAFSQAWISTVHNKYLLVLSETGILGLVTFTWMLVAGLVLAYRGSQIRDPALAAISAGIATGISGMMIHMTVDIFHSRPHVQMLFLTLGLVAAVTESTRTDDDEGAIPLDAAAGRPIATHR